MEMAFGASILGDPNWGRIKARLDALPINVKVVQLIHTWESMIGYSIEKGPAGGGTSGNASTKTITIDGNFFPTTSGGGAAMTPQQINHLLDVLTHEIAHQVGMPNELKDWHLADTPSQAQSRLLQNEARAIVAQYINARQLSIDMRSDTNALGENIETILNGVAATHGSYTSPAFEAEARTRAEAWARNANPSIAPNLTYAEYGRMAWALTFANQGSLSVNWHQVLPGQITTDIDPATNQVTISTLAPIPLRGTTDTVSVTGTYDLLLGTTIGTESVIRNQNGVPIGTTSNTLQPDGSNRIEIRGEGVHAAGNDSRVFILTGNRDNFDDHRVRFTGDNNVITPPQTDPDASHSNRNSPLFDVVGSNNTIGNYFIGYVTVQGANNVLNAVGITTNIVTGINNTVNVTQSPHDWLPAVGERRPRVTLGGLNNTVNFSGSYPHGGGFVATYAGMETSATINGTDLEIHANGADLMTISGSSNDLVIGVSASATLNGTGHTVQGSNSFLTLGNNSSATITGTANTVTLNAAATVTFGASSSATVTGNAATINASASGSTLTVNGSGHVMTKGSNGAITINGSNNQLNLTGSASAATLNGTGQIVNATSDTINFGSGSTGRVNGNGNTVNLTGAAAIALTVNGTGQIVNATSDFITLANNSSMTLTGTGNSVTLGTGNTVTLGASASATITGNTATVNAGATGSTLTVNGSHHSLTKGSSGSITVNGSNTQLTLTGSGSAATLNGTGQIVTATSDTITFASGSSGRVNGNGNTLNLTGANAIALTVNGTGSIVNATSDYLTVGNNGSMTLAGNGNVVTTGSGSTATVNGNSNQVSVGTSGVLTWSGTGNRITAASNTIHVGNGARGVVQGNSNVINLGTSDVIFVSGSSNLVNVQSGDILYLASNVAVTVVGSGATIVGNTGNVISLTGANNRIYGNSGHLVVNGATSTGNIVQGSAMTGDRTTWGGYVHNAGPYGGFAGGGYYASAANSALPAARVGGMDISGIAAGSRTRAVGLARRPGARLDAAPDTLERAARDLAVENSHISLPELRPLPTKASLHASLSIRMADQLVSAMAAWSTNGTSAMHVRPEDPAVLRGSHALVADVLPRHGRMHRGTSVVM